jgi:mannose-1-phosphate guanylyltransferase
MLPTMILAAGLGSRLRPLTDSLPKPLVAIGDRPAIEHIRAHLAANGVTKCVLNTFHLFEALAAYATSHGIALSAETQLLGTAGGLRAAAGLLGEGAVLVWNGDILAKPNLQEGLATHVGSAARATLWVKEVPKGEGNVGFTADGRVARLRRESFAAEVRAGEFCGIHIVGPELRALLPQEGCLVGDVYLPALRRGERLGVALLDTFADIGSLRSYAEANFAWLRVWAAEQGLGVAASYVAKTASVGTELDSCIIGEGAHVEAHVALRRCIVWPGTRVTGPAYDCVLTPAGLVPFLDER